MYNIEIRGYDEDQRIVTGIAVPYEETTDLGGIQEVFTRGSISHDEDLPLYLNHKEPIGVVLAGVDTDNGYAIRAKISKTQLGDDAVTLIKDKAIKSFSVGFEDLETDKSQGLLRRVKAKLHEVSLVGVPAYSGAKVLSYRNDGASSHEENSQEEIMETTNDLANEIETLREDVLALQRNAVVETSEPVINYRSYGDYIKGYVHDEENAKVFYRAWASGDGTSADSVIRDGWVGDKVRILEKPRKVLNVFGRAALPEEGLNVEYAKLSSDTTQVGVQAAEGDALLKGKVAVAAATAPVKTYGGYSALTRQEVERASVNILDKTFSALTAKYAAATNSAVRAAVVAASTQSVTGGSLAAATGKTWLGVVVDAATALDTYNYTLDSLVVSGDVFKAIATLTDGSDRPLLYTSNPTNNIGSVGGLSATLAGVPVVVDPGAAVRTVWAVTSEAATTYESSGAPFRLQDGNIANLTNEYSIYGYLAFAIHDTNGIVKVTLTA